MNWRHQWIFSLLISLFGFSAFPAMALEPPKPITTTYPGSVPESFEELDLNKDGIISKTEWRGNLDFFYRLDDNGDKVLTRVEFSDREDERLDAFDKLDKNHDGVISRGEWKIDRTQFDRIDDNRDGSISRAEFFRKRESFQETFQTLDANQDGIISKLEWRGKMEEFKRIDADHNGVITLPEYNQGTAVYRPLIK